MKVIWVSLSLSLPDMRTDHFLKYSRTLSLIFRLILSPVPQSVSMLSPGGAANLPPPESEL